MSLTSPSCRESPRFLDSSEPVKTMAGQGNDAKGTTMYIGLGTLVLIVVLFLLFRALSGRRV